MDYFQKLLEEAMALIRSKNMTLSTAESCTGGLLGGAVTRISGISEIYMGGVISYSNDVKRDILGVRQETLNSFGAVSKETALEMAQGVRTKLSTSIGVSTTGIAGPTGGTKEKPVGLVYIAIATEGRQTFKELHLKGDREEVRKETMVQVLTLIIDFLGGNI